MTLRSRLIVAAAVAFVAVVAAVTALAVMRNRNEPPYDPAETTLALGAAESTARPSVDASDAPLEMPSAPQPRAATPLRPFDVGAAMATVRALEAFGPKGGGSDAERQAAEYLKAQLEAAGLKSRIEEFPLPNGSTSRNVIARIQGTSDRVLVLGAHMDTKPPSPGANDNGSGCAAQLEIARILAAQPVTPTVEIVFFGSEETNGGDPNGHHYGSRFRVSQMSAAERGNTAGMISIDMIGYGPSFHSRTMGKGPLTLSDLLLARASALGIKMTYLKDPGKSGWSDHEAYELAGIPVSWIEWRDDPVYHTEGDVAAHLQPARIETAGRLVLDFVRSLTDEQLGQLTAR